MDIKKTKVKIKPKEDQPKRSRPDRAIKLKDRKEKNETVVKSSLLKYIQGDANIKIKIVNALKSRVEAYSKRMNLASIALSGMIKEMFAGKNDVRTVQIPDILDQTFIRQLILGTNGSQDANPIIQSIYQRYPEYQRVTQRHSADRNIYSSGTIKYITNLKNSFSVPFISRVRKFSNEYSIKNGTSKIEEKVMMYLINGWTVPSRYGIYFPMNKKIMTTIAYHRNILGLVDGEGISKQWLKSKNNSHNVIRYYVLLNRFKEKNNFPTFNIIPICRLGAHFMTVDSSTLYGIMKDIKLIDCNEETYNEFSQDHWQSIINIQRLQGRDNEFTGSIETDGISLCTHFTRPKNLNDETAKKNKLTILPTDRVIGIDPGRANIFFGAEQMARKKWYIQ
jgi:hypothetical protein